MLLKKAGGITVETNSSDDVIDTNDILNIKKSNGGFDRIFPNQDFLHDGGLGNLIALPLQYQACQKGIPYFLIRIITTSLTLINGIY